jgi:NAD(P)-dependent dehydrogenase (short-subunit alcohol dehydrogenase family)
MNAADGLGGKVALVTGAAGGIGRVTAARFGAAGCRVVAADLDEAGGARTAAAIVAAGGEAMAAGVDVADESSVKAAFKQARDRYGPVDALVNVAGVWAGGSVTELAVEDWDRTMAVNARGVFLCAREALPDMVARRGGAIVSVASIAALKGTRRAGAYNPSKAAVVALTKNMALDYAEHGIRVNAICPGLIGGTDMELELRRFRGDTPDYQEWVVGLHPLGRLGTPDDVADAAVFLASHRASWITGTCLVVDGGCMTGY